MNPASPARLLCVRRLTALALTSLLLFASGCSTFNGFLTAQNSRISVLEKDNIALHEARTQLLAYQSKAR